jgi:hypothetical protein
LDSNPWSRSAEASDEFAMVCGACPAPADLAFTKADLDESTSPHENFFECKRTQQAIRRRSRFLARASF